MSALRSLLLLPVLALGCASPSVSVVSFRSPPGSVLSFKGEEGVDAGRVVFPGHLELVQFASDYDEATRTFTGTLRVNGLVEEERVPSEARSLLVEGEGGVDIPVKGFYRVFERPTSTEESLNVYPLDVSASQLILLMKGKAVTITAQEGGVIDLSMGLDLEATRSGAN